MIHCHLIHVYGTSGAGPAVREAMASLLKRAPGTVIHAPVTLPGADPLPVDQDERLVLLQLGHPAMAQEIDRVASGVHGVREVRHQAMACERITRGAPDDPTAPSSAVSWWVQYNGPAKDPAAFHRYYREHHVPIVHRMPGIRSLNWYLPTSRVPASGLRRVDHLQLVQAVFDDVQGLLAMRASRERKEGLKDFDNYPAFEGPVTHQAMLSQRISFP